MKQYLPYAAALALAAAASVASGAPVIDQQQTSADLFVASFGQLGLAQSFTPTANSVAGAGIFVSADGGSGPAPTVTLSLWSALPNDGGSELASVTATSPSEGWFDVFFDPVSVTAGATYFLVFSSTSVDLRAMGAASDPYAGGQTYANAGFGSFPTLDYAFRTYTETEAPVPVPLPPTLPLVGLGLAGIALLRGRNRA